MLLTPAGAARALPTSQPARPARLELRAGADNGLAVADSADPPGARLAAAAAASSSPVVGRGAPMNRHRIDLVSFWWPRAYAMPKWDGRRVARSPPSLFVGWSFFATKP